MCHELRRRLLTATLVLSCLAGAAMVPETATAQPPESLSPGTKPWFFDAGLGWSSGGLNLYTQFKLVQELGYHFSGDSSGPAIGVALSESFGNGFATFAGGAKFWWDIQILGDLGLYATPFAVAGVAVATAGSRFLNDSTQGFFNFQFGAQAKLVINDSWNVFVRPVAFDFFAGEYFAWRYDFIAGGVLIF